VARGFSFHRLQEETAVEKKKNGDPQVTGAIEEERKETGSRQRCRELLYLRRERYLNSPALFNCL